MVCILLQVALGAGKCNAYGYVMKSHISRSRRPHPLVELRTVAQTLRHPFNLGQCVQRFEDRLNKYAACKLLAGSGYVREFQRDKLSMSGVPGMGEM